jgi:hypothetical protein
MYKSTQRYQVYRGYPVNTGLGVASVARGGAYIDQQMRNADAIFASKMQPIMTQLTEELEEKIQAQVAATTATILAMNAIPVVGNIVAGIAAVVSSLAGDKYQRKTEEVLSNFKKNVTKLKADYNIKARNEITAVIKSVEDNAVKLALSGAVLPPPPPEVPIQGLGFGGIGSALKRAGRSINRAVSKIGREIGRPFEQAWDAIEKGLEYLTGEAAYKEAKAAAEKGWGIAKSSYKTAYAEIMDGVKSQQFKNDLTIDMAREIRNDPDIQQMIHERQQAELAIIQNVQRLKEEQARAAKAKAQYEQHQAELADPSNKKVQAAPIAAAAAIPIIMALIT